jgi:hypothetical protein
LTPQVVFQVVLLIQELLAHDLPGLEAFLALKRACGRVAARRLQVQASPRPVLAVALARHGAFPGPAA